MFGRSDGVKIFGEQIIWVPDSKIFTFFEPKNDVFSQFLDPHGFRAEGPMFFFDPFPKKTLRFGPPSPNPNRKVFVFLKCDWSLRSPWKGFCLILLNSLLSNSDTNNLPFCGIVKFQWRLTRADPRENSRWHRQRRGYHRLKSHAGNPAWSVGGRWPVASKKSCRWPPAEKWGKWGCDENGAKMGRK